MALYLLIFAVVLCLGFILPALAYRLGLVDHPDHRKRHDRPTPLVGGLMIFPPCLLVLGVQGMLSLPLMLALILMLVIGLIDDIRHVRPWQRLVFQALAATLVVWGESVTLTSLGDLLGAGAPIPLGGFGSPMRV